MDGLARLATFALLPLSIGVAVNCVRLARLGFYYCGSPPTFVCSRCRQSFAVTDRRLETHTHLCCLLPDAVAATLQQQQQQQRQHGVSNDHKGLFTAHDLTDHQPSWFRCSRDADARDNHRCRLLQLSLSQPLQVSDHPAPTDPELSCTCCCQSSQIQSHHSHPPVSTLAKDNSAH